MSSFAATRSPTPSPRRSENRSTWKRSIGLQGIDASNDDNRPIQFKEYRSRVEGKCGCLLGCMNVLWLYKQCKTEDVPLSQHNRDLMTMTFNLGTVARSAPATPWGAISSTTASSSEHSGTYSLRSRNLFPVWPSLSPLPSTSDSFWCFYEGTSIGGIDTMKQSYPNEFCIWP